MWIAPPSPEVLSELFNPINVANQTFSLKIYVYCYGKNGPLKIGSPRIEFFDK